MTPIMKYFEFNHLPKGIIQDTSKMFCDLAKVIDSTVPDGPEKSAGLRKLMEAKDCMVRAVLP